MADREGDSWGQVRRPSLDATCGTTAEISRARDLLRQVGIEGDTLAAQAEKAAHVLNLVKAMADAD